MIEINGQDGCTWLAGFGVAGQRMRRGSELGESGTGCCVAVRRAETGLYGLLQCQCREGDLLDFAVGVKKRDAGYETEQARRTKVSLVRC